MKKAFSIAAFILFLFGFTVIDAASKTIVLKGITHLPKANISNDHVPLFIERVNKRAQGRLKIDWVGGPEVIKGFDQIHALKSGTMDMIIYAPFGYMASVMPEAFCKGLSELTEWEERKTGAFEVWSEIIEKRVNAKYLGRFKSLTNFVIYSKKKVTKLEDFKGLKIRVMPLYIPFIKSLGAVPVTIRLPETYTALERGVVDALMFVKFSMVNLGFHEVTKYVIEPGVFQVEPATMINLEKWKTIPDDLQEMLMDVMIDMEYITSMRFLQIVQHEDELRKKAGMEFIQLPPDDAEKYRKLAYEKTWEHVLKNSPEYGPRLRELTSKKAIPKGAFPWH